jgi:hypothetical protein
MYTDFILKNAPRVLTQITGKACPDIRKLRS